MITADHVLSLRPFLTLSLFSIDRDDSELTPRGRDARTELLRLVPLIPDLWTLIRRFQEEIDQIINLTDEPDGNEEETVQQSLVYSVSVAAVMCFKCQSSDIMFFMPAVHSHLFTLQQVLPLVHSLFERSEVAVNIKGLFLLNHLLRNVGESAIPTAFYDVLIKHPVHKSLVRVMRYSSDAECRKQAVAAFKRLVSAFNPIGRVNVVSFLISDPKQASGMIELLLQQYRDFVMHDSCTFYGGVNLKNIIVRSTTACFRFSEECNSNNSADELVRHSESILAILNFVRFLLISGTRHETKIIEMKSLIRDRLIVPLKQEMKSNKHKLEQEMSRLCEQDSRSKAQALNQIKDLQLKIGNDNNEAGNTLELAENCPDDFQEQGVQMSLIKIEMIQSVVDRVEELVV
jgi:hypothetical protein